MSMLSDLESIRTALRVHESPADAVGMVGVPKIRLVIPPAADDVGEFDLRISVERWRVDGAAENISGIPAAYTNLFRVVVACRATDFPAETLWDIIDQIRVTMEAHRYIYDYAEVLDDVERAATEHRVAASFSILHI